MEARTAMTLGTVVHVIFPILTIVLATYLFYIRGHRKQFLSKDRPGTPTYEVRAKLLDNHFLAIALLLAGNAIVGITADALTIGLHAKYAKAIAGFIVLFTSLIGLFILYDWRNQKRKFKN